MKIRKQFRVESAHIVRNCYTDRCKKSIHGHSAVIDLVLKGSGLDNAGMLMDFKMVNQIAKSLVDSMDHTTLIWSKDDPEYLDAIKKYSDRYIEFDFNPSAENLALWLHYTIDGVLKWVNLKNGECSNIKVDSVRYHETTTGYAESESSDLYINDDINVPQPDVFTRFNTVVYSESVIDDWSEQLKKILIEGMIYNPPAPEQQVSVID